MSQKLRMAKCSTTGKCSGLVLTGNAIRSFTREKRERIRLEWVASPIGVIPVESW